MIKRDRIILQKIDGYVTDILECIDGLTLETFLQDKKAIFACAFAVTQIGVLAKDISSETQELVPEIPWKSIRTS